MESGVYIRTASEGRALSLKDVEWYVDDNGCHICTSHTRLERGYHMVTRGGRRYTLHRRLYMDHHGLTDSDVEGFVVMHSCDNPSCINIDHLSLGTQRDNMRDRISKGR